MVQLSQRYIVAFVAFFGYMCLTWLQLNFSAYKGFYYSGKEMHITKNLYIYGLTCVCFGGILVTRFGGASLFGIAISVSAITNLLTRLIYSSLDFTAFPLGIFLIVQGFFHAIAECSVADLWSRWSAPQERLKLVFMPFLGTLVGKIIYQKMYSLISGWYFFYITGGVAFIWALFWMFVLKVKNDPDDDERVSDEEKQYLANKIQITDKDRHNAIYPWKSIFTSCPFWILCLTSFILSICDTFTIYIHESRKILRSTTTATILIVVGEIILILIVAYAAHRIAKKKKYTHSQTRQFYITLAIVIGAISLTAYFYFWQYFQYHNFALLQAAVHGYLNIAFLVNAIDLSPKYSGILYGIQTSLTTIAMAITQQLISSLLHVAAKDESRVVSFWYKAVIVLYLLSALLYHYCGSGELQEWNNPKREQLELQARENGDLA